MKVTRCIEALGVGGFALAVLSALVLAAGGCGTEGGTAASRDDFGALLQEGRLVDAERVARALVKEDRTSIAHRGNLAMVLCMRGDAELAKAGYFDREPDAARKALEKPEAQEALKLFRDAKTQALAALELPEGAASAKDRARVRGTLGLALYRAGQAKEAVEELKKALSEDDSLAAVHNTLGLVYYDMGWTKEAQSEYLAALQLDSGLADAAYNLAVRYEDEMAGLKKDAREARDKGEQPGDDTLRRMVEAGQETVVYYRRYLMCRTGYGPAREEIEARIKEIERDVKEARTGAAVPRPAAGRLA